jgi:hypothetical protein
VHVQHTAPAFDPFAASPQNSQFGQFVSAAPVSYAQPVSATPVNQSQYGFQNQFQNAAPAHVNPSYSTPQVNYGANNSNNFGSFQQAPAPAPQENQDFGDFESAKPVVPVKAKAAAVDNWSNLVNLSDIKSKNDVTASSSAPKDKAGYGNQDSFSGLDGFSKPQNTV